MSKDTAVPRLRFPEFQDAGAWEKKPIADVAKIVNGGTPKTTIKEFWGGDVQWLTPKDMAKLTSKKISNTPRTISAEGLAKSSANLVPEHSVILSTRAPIGHLAINQVPMSFSQGCKGLVPGKNLDTGFLFYFLMVNVDYLDSLGTSTTFRELSSKTLARIKIPLPSLAEQQKIADCLSSADELIEAETARREALKAHKKGLMQGLFPSADTPTPRLRFPAFRDSGAWPEVRLGDVCEVIAGQSPEGKYYNSERQGLPFYQGKKEFGKKYINKPSIWTSNTTKLAKSGDILMSVRAPVGPVNFSVEDICIGRGLAAIRAGEKINAEFIFYTLLNMQNAISGDRGSVFSSINKKQIEEIIFPLPPLAEQQKIAACLSSADELIEAVSEKVTLLQKHKKGLMQQLFPSGTKF